MMTPIAMFDHGTSVHEVKDEAEFVGGVEGVRHADDERTIWNLLSGTKGWREKTAMVFVKFTIHPVISSKSLWTFNIGLPRSMLSDWRTWGLWLWWCPSWPVIVWMITMLMVKPTIIDGVNDNTSDSDWWRSLPCPVETRLSMILSLRASVSPCFILIRFLSRHCKFDNDNDFFYFFIIIIIASSWSASCPDTASFYRL